jgi:hypothetical protein
MTIRARDRPSLYHEEFAEQARKLCLLGVVSQFEICPPDGG